MNIEDVRAEAAVAVASTAAAIEVCKNQQFCGRMPIGSHAALRGLGFRV